MKEIKTFIRPDVANSVVHELKNAGFCCMTITEVAGLGTPLADAGKASYSIDFVEKYSKVAKLELVCDDSDEDRVVEIIQTKARTHQLGDGLIFVTTVDRAVRIRTGEEGAHVIHL